MPGPVPNWNMKSLVPFLFAQTETAPHPLPCFFFFLSRLIANALKFCTKPKIHLLLNGWVSQAPSSCKSWGLCVISSEFLWLSCFHIASGCEQFSFFLTALIFRQIEERVDLLEHYFIKRRERSERARPIWPRLIQLLDLNTTKPYTCFFFFLLSLPWVFHFCPDRIWKEVQNFPELQVPGR